MELKCLFIKIVIAAVSLYLKSCRHFLITLDIVNIFLVSDSTVVVFTISVLYLRCFCMQ